jgi:hypothetical protein
VSERHEDGPPSDPDPLDDESSTDQAAEDPDPPPAPSPVPPTTSPGDVVQAVADFVNDLVEDTDAADNEER